MTGSRLRASPVGGELDGLTAFDQENFSAYRPELFRQCRVTEKLPVFAVHGDEIFRLHKLQQDFHFFLAGVAGHMNRRGPAAFVIDQHAPAEEMIDHAKNILLVTGNDSRGQNHGIVFGDVHQAVIVHGDARKRGKRLGLRSTG